MSFISHSLDIGSSGSSLSWGERVKTVAVGFRREKATKEAKVNLVLAEENCKILKFFFDIKSQNKCPSLLITMVSHSMHATAAPSPLGTR